MANVGVSNLHYAVLSKDDETGVKYDEVKKVAGTIQIDVQPNSNSSTLYADNGAYDTDTALGEITVTLELADLDLETQSTLLGHSFDDGVQICKASDTAPYVALAFEALKSNGKKRYVKILKGKFEEVDETVKTKDNNVTFQTSKISGKFLVRKHDGIWKKVADEDSTGYTDTIGSAWYANIETTA